jgi:hypothetical protein
MIRHLPALLACAMSLGGAPAWAAAPDNLPSAISELANENIRRAIVDSARQLTPEGRVAVGRAILACQLPGDAAVQVSTGKFASIGFNAACSRAYDEAQPLCADGGCREFFSYVTLEKETAAIMTDPTMQYMLNNVDQATAAKLKDNLAKQRLYADGLRKVLEDSAQ